MKEKDAFAQKLQIQLDEFGAEIERLKERADKTESDAQPWHRKEIEILQDKHKSAKSKLRELRESGDDAWDDMKEGLVTAWNAVSVAVKSATERFQ